MVANNAVSAEKAVQAPDSTPGAPAHEAAVAFQKGPGCPRGPNVCMLHMDTFKQ